MFPVLGLVLAELSPLRVYLPKVSYFTISGESNKPPFSSSYRLLLSTSYIYISLPFSSSSGRFVLRGGRVLGVLSFLNMFVDERSKVDFRDIGLVFSVLRSFVKMFEGIF